MIYLTPAAVQELQRLLGQQPDSSLVQIRLGIQPGCCAEWLYTFAPNATNQEGDTCISNDGVELVVNQAHLPLLEGLTIDYSEDLLGGGFRYQNPKATHTCDCGTSFSTTPSEEPLEAPELRTKEPSELLTSEIQT
ncbi:MAG: HesB/IscA family protein [Leptolyngbyaceae cyanobacterium]